MTKSVQSIIHLVLSRALLGILPANLRVVEVKIEEKQAFIYFIYDQDLGDEEREDLMDAVAKVQCVVSSEYEYNISFDRLDFPAKLPIDGSGFYVYHRKEKEA